jgi:hypothetical protein
MQVAKDAFYLIGFPALQCMEYHDSKTGHDLFFVFQRVSPVNTVNTNVLPVATEIPDVSEFMTCRA